MHGFAIPRFKNFHQFSISFSRHQAEEPQKIQIFQFLRQPWFLILIGVVSFVAMLTNDFSLLRNSAPAMKNALAMSQLQNSAMQGDALAQRRLALRYLSSDQQNIDYAKAMYWLEKAAQKGDAIAQVNLGILLTESNALPQDLQKAFYWLNQAATRGNAHAQYRLGAMYSEGIAVQHDDAAAVYWYRLAADQGLASAQFNLGLKFLHGEGVSQNSWQGYRYMLLASLGVGMKNIDSRDLVSVGLTNELKNDA